MFKAPPQILGHISALKSGSLVTPKYIVANDEGRINLLNRMCPHRFFPIGEKGEVVQDITCKFHGFSFDVKGSPVNNSYKLPCTSGELGKSGLIIRNFKEPDHHWVTDLASETDLNYSHSMLGKSQGSWLWMHEVQIDLMHIRKGGIHPVLSQMVNMGATTLDEGENWIIQTYDIGTAVGWWLLIYPFTFIEWTKGCLAINSVVPNNIDEEYGFEWMTQFYYTDEITHAQKEVFELVEPVFHEDVAAIEQLQRPFSPLTRIENELEKHPYHFGQWVSRERNK